MANWPFERLSEFGCVVKFGYVPITEIHEKLSIDMNTDNRREHREKLIQSIKNEGVRNPLICSAFDGAPTFVQVGHHRLWAAKKAGARELPVIVNDFCNRYPTFEILGSLTEVRTKFKDQPNLVKSFRSGVSTSEPLINNETWWK